MSGNALEASDLAASVTSLAAWITDKGGVLAPEASPWAGHGEFDLDATRRDDIFFHPGMAHILTRALDGYAPIVYTADDRLRLCFNVVDDSETTRAFVREVCNRIAAELSMTREPVPHTATVEFSPTVARVYGIDSELAPVLMLPVPDGDGQG